MTCKIQDLVIDKKSKFFRVFELETTENIPISLNEKTLKCQIKESYSTETNLFELTEANEGIVIIDRTNGIFALNIKSDKTNVDVDYAVYDIVEIETGYVGTENRVLIRGKIHFKKGVTS